MGLSALICARPSTVVKHTFRLEHRTAVSRWLPVAVPGFTLGLFGIQKDRPTVYRLVGTSDSFREGKDAAGTRAKGATAYLQSYAASCVQMAVQTHNPGLQNVVNTTAPTTAQGCDSRSRYW